MDEPTNNPADGGSSPRRPVVAAVQLAPAQEAYSAYATHFTGCGACRDLDRTCETGTELWRAWRRESDAAGRLLRGETA
ncbi:hypothetical protein AB0N14_13350 [Streptomyces sp. NPDC051104]|uniref:hypothetical protein n=1 Tax=Streptomyces sp. NPDC051104 TaxID=3155044 RepID=UPI00342A10ED